MPTPLSITSPAIFPFIVGGYPSLSATAEALPALSEAGAAVIEVGFPFSDPIADGPIIAAAMHDALRSGVTIQKLLGTIAAARSKTSASIVGMVSISIVHRTGIDAFMRSCASAGLNGLIVPDVPLDEAPLLTEAAKRAGLTLSFLIAPTTPPDRAERIARACTGFVYLLARVGITGTDGAAASQPIAALADRIRRLRAVTSLPIACGFGIKTPEDVRAVVAPPPAGAGADAAIVGTALVQAMTEGAKAGHDPAQAAASLTRRLAEGLPVAG